jgi:hypothetical protein
MRSQFFPAILLFTAVVPAAADPVTIISATRFVQAARLTVVAHNDIYVTVAVHVSQCHWAGIVATYS